VDSALGTFHSEKQPEKLCIASAGAWFDMPGILYKNLQAGCQHLVWA